MLLSKSISGFILAKQADGLSFNTLDIYRWALDKLTAFLNDKPVEDVTVEDLRRFFAYLKDDYHNASITRKRERLSASSRQDAWVAVKSFWRWAHNELGAERVDTSIKRPEGETPVITPFSEDDVRAMLKAAERVETRPGERRKSFALRYPTSARNVALILLLLDTGLRVSEAARLKVGNVDLATGETTVEPHGSGRKTKSRHVYLGKVARRAVWKYLAQREDAMQFNAPLFVTEDDKPMSKFSIGLVIRRIGKRAGVPNAHPHRFRHTFAVQYLRNGGDTFTLQRLLGHSTMEMVRRYLDLADADDAEAHRRASPADHWRL